MALTRSSRSRRSAGMIPPGRRLSFEAAGVWLRDRQSFIRWIQWLVAIVYGALLIVPVVAPTPTRESRLWSDAVLFAQFIFWGIWWPCVLASIVLVGRAWCGLFCPEGMLSETASQYGRGRSIPTWIKWKGWPFVAFSCTTIYGQMVSVYQYPKPALLVLGGSTVAAMGIGFLYGRGKRVWCRYLCPVNGVFALLAKLSPFHFAVDRMAWKDWEPGMGLSPHPVNCAPLVPIKTMRGASKCHMCGRCAGFKQAIALERRSPSAEILHVAGHETQPWETILILFGLMGLAGGAFQWSVSPFYGMAKQALAEWLVDHGGIALLQPWLPWWILTNYPEQNDILTPLDGVVMVAYILTSACLTTLGLGALLWLSARALGPWDRGRLHHLAQCLIPFAACGVFLGLSATSVTLLQNEGVSFEFIGEARAMFLIAAGGWSVWLFWGVSGHYTRRLWRRLAASFLGMLGVFLGSVHWVLLFWLW